MTKAELTAENNPACDKMVRQMMKAHDERHTNIKVALRSSSYFLT